MNSGGHMFIDPGNFSPAHGVTGCLSSSSAFALLTRIVRDLTMKSDDSRTRENHRHFVEQQFKNSDVRIDRAISDSSGQLAKLIHLFNQVLKLLEDCRDEGSYCLIAVRTSKSLLHMRRLDIRDLWEESVFQGRLAQIYDLINELSEVDARVKTYVRESRFVHAVDLVIRAYKQQIFESITVDSSVGDDLRRYLLKVPHERLGSEIVKAIDVYTFGDQFAESGASLSIQNFIDDEISLSDKLSFENPDHDKVWSKKVDALHKVIGEAIRLADAAGLNARTSNGDSSSVSMPNETMSAFVLQSVEAFIQERFTGIGSTLATKYKILPDYLNKLFGVFRDAAHKCSLIIEHIDGPHAERSRALAWSTAERVYVDILYEHIRPLDEDNHEKYHTKQSLSSFKFDKYFEPAINRMSSYANPNVNIGTSGITAGSYTTAYGIGHRVEEFKFRRSAQSQKMQSKEKTPAPPKKEIALVCEPNIENIQKAFRPIKRAIDGFGRSRESHLEKLVIQIVRESLIASIDVLDKPIRAISSYENSDLILGSLIFNYDRSRNPKIILASSKAAFDAIKRLKGYSDDMTSLANDFAIASNDVLVRHCNVCSSIINDMLNLKMDDSRNKYNTDDFSKLSPLCLEWVIDPDTNRYLTVKLCFLGSFRLHET
ncbi:hypothetical protein ACOME3_008759 [Neoechinorhynchus agilis]